MKKNIICKILFLSVVTNSILSFSPVKAFENDLTNYESEFKKSVVTSSELEMSPRSSQIISPYTAYDWWVYNLGVDAWGISQIMGPISGGKFNTEGAWGGNRTFTIKWSGASSNAKFKIKAVGQDEGNSGSVNYNDGGYCTGSSGTTTLKIPFADRGSLKIYVDSYVGSTINIGSLHLDSR